MRTPKRKKGDTEDGKGLEIASERVGLDGDLAEDAAITKDVVGPSTPRRAARAVFVHLVHVAVRLDVDEDTAVDGLREKKNK